MNKKYIVSLRDSEGNEFCKMLSTSLKNAISRFKKLDPTFVNTNIEAHWVLVEDYRITTIKELKKGDYFWLIYNDRVGKTPYVKDIYDQSSKKYIACKFYDFCSSRLFRSEQLVTDEITF